MTDHDTAARTDADRAGFPLLVVVLAVLCVAALVAAVWLTIWLRGETADNERLAQDRVAVRQAAERFTESWNTFEAGEAEQYVESVAPLLSTKFRAEFEDAASDVVTGIEQQQLSSTGTVLADRDEVPLVGIASMDGDSAQVLVVADAQRSVSGQDVLRHWRWQVRFVKSDGEWLVDGFEEV
jgi:hypothetical protein